MDEREYKSTYNYINPTRCVFEKAINTRICNCSKSQRFNLADREGVACHSAQSLERCSKLISQLRINARFVFQRKETSQALAHTEEIKIQNGGLIGLQTLLQSSNDKIVKDIDRLISDAETKYQELEKIPYSQLMKDISAYSLRKHRRKKHSE